MRFPYGFSYRGKRYRFVRFIISGPVQPRCFRGAAVMESDDLPLRIENRASRARRVRWRTIVHEALVIIDIE
jgi:hypothetical protein